MAKRLKSGGYPLFRRPLTAASASDHHSPLYSITLATIRLRRLRSATEQMPSTVNSSRAQSEELGNEDAPAYSANGRPLRKSAGKRQSDPEFVNSTEVIQDAMGDMKEDNKMLLTSGRRTKTVKRKRARSPSPSAPPLSPVQCITDADFTTPQETTPAPVEVTETTESEVPGINLTINIPAGFVGPIKLQLDQSLLSKFTQSQAKSPKNVAPAKPAERLSSLNPTLFKRAKAAEDAQKTKTSKSKKLTKWIKKYGSPPRGFLDLPAGESSISTLAGNGI